MGKCSNAFFSDTTNIIKAKLYMNVHWMVLYKLYVVCSDMKFKMAAMAGLSLTLDPMGKMFQNASSLKPLGQLKPNCPGMIIGRSSTNFISSPGPKVQVNYCHHLASVVCRLSSVVCKLFTFQASSPKPLGRLEPNLAGMFLGWSSTKLLFFVPVGYSIWLPGPIICSDWLKFQRSSSPKLMNWLNPNCKGMIIGMSFTKLLFFMPIGNPRWPPSQDID